MMIINYIADMTYSFDNYTEHRLDTIDIEQIQCVAHDYGWEIVFYKEDNKLYRFQKGKQRIDVWLTGTVGLYKKKQGREKGKDEYRRNQTQQQIEDLFRE